MPYWDDPTVTIGRIAMLFGTTPKSIRRKKDEWGLPDRKPRHLDNRRSVSREALEPLWRDPKVSIKSITVTLGIPDRAVIALAREFGLGSKPKFAQKTNPPPADKESLRALWDSEDKTLVQIARSLGCTEKTVRSWARRYGFGPRPGSEARDPSEEEIYAMAAKLRADWPEWRLRT